MGSFHLSLNDRFGRFGLQSDGFGKREITLLLAFPLSRFILALPSINIAWQIMGTCATKKGGEGKTRMAPSLDPFSIAHLSSVFGQRNHVREEQWGDWVPLSLRFSPFFAEPRVYVGFLGKCGEEGTCHRFLAVRQVPSRRRLATEL